jgi:hypothetical protein
MIIELVVIIAQAQARKLASNASPVRCQSFDMGSVAV